MDTLLIKSLLLLLLLLLSFPKIPEEVRSFPETSESGISPRISQSQSWDAYKRELAPSAFRFKNQRSRGRCYLFILHIVFVPYMGLS